MKIIKSIKSDEEEQLLIQSTLKKFMDILLQPDPKSIIPPFLKLDRKDKAIPDLSANFDPDAIDSFSLQKHYFSIMSTSDEAGFLWCSVIIAQNISCHQLQDKARHSFQNQSFGR